MTVEETKTTTGPVDTAGEIDADRSSVTASLRTAKGVERIRLWLAVVLAVTWTLWQVWIALTVAPSPIHARSLHLAFAFATAFTLVPGFVAKRSPRLGLVADIALGGAAVVALMHVFFTFNNPDFMRVVRPEPIDLVLAVVLLVVTLIALWRVTGLALAITVLIALAYGFFGQFIPGALGHAGFPPERILSILYTTLDGILGSTTGASATTIFPVLLFGAMLLVLGGGKFFSELALAGFGRMRGAGGKVATVASALFSTVTGTGGSGVAATGVLTIPLMKRTGYPATNAAGIESAASVGGQILPPIMGASAFAMAEFLALPYSAIVTHALIPGVLYFVTVFVMVHLEARRLDLKPLTPEEIPRLKPTLAAGWHYLVPLVAFVVLIAVIQVSPAKAAIWSTGVLIVLEFGRRALTRRGLRLSDLVDGCMQTARSAIIVAIAVAGIQTLIAVVGLTGLGIKLSSLMLAIAGDSLIVLLLLTMVASILLGTGLPTLPTYMVLAVLIAPALVEFGVPIVAAHFFILYFGVFSDLTPPTALGPTIAAGIARAPVLRSMMSSMRYGLLGFALPYMFIATPGLLMLTGPGDAVVATLLTLVVIFAAGAGLVGFGLVRMEMPERVLAVVLAIGMAVPMPVVQAIAGVIAAALLISQLVRLRRSSTDANTSLPRSGKA